MALNLKDRYRLLKRFVKVFFSDTPQIGLTWKEGTRILSYHVYDARVTDRYNIHLEYMAQAAAHSKSIADLNERLMYFTEKTLAAYYLINKIDANSLIFQPPKVKLKSEESTNGN
jgi:hypothetical protein